MERRDFDIDHIDPRWEEGRDYQLVCGLDCPLNYREEEPGKNSAKSNRFLPWRWSRDGIGVVPEDYGDLAQFLVNGEWVLMEFLSEEWFEASIGTCSRSHRTIDSEPLRKGWEEWRKNNPEEYSVCIQNFINSGREWVEENKEEHLRLVKEGREKLYSKNPGLKDLHVKVLHGGFKDWFSNLSDEELKERAEVISKSTKEAMANLPPEKKQILVNNGKESAKKQHAQRWMCTVTGYVTTPAPLSCYQKKRGIDTSNRIRLQ